MSAGSEMYKRWRLPEIEALGPVTAAQLQALQKQAFDEAFSQGKQAGFEKGYRDGKAHAEAELKPLIEQCKALLAVLAKPLSILDDEMEHALVSLAMAVARQLVRRELKSEPGEVIAVVRQAMSSLPLVTRNVRLHLNPEDRKLVQDALALDLETGPWEIVEDPVLTRGGCRIETDVSRIDASVEARLSAVIAQTLGGDREDDDAS